LSDDRFDELAKAAATTTSRRQVLKLLGGSFAGALFAGGFLGSHARAAGNDCLPSGSLCKVNGDCCKTPDVLGNESSCCCRSPKQPSTVGQGFCMDRDFCIGEMEGVCH
jgi:hypothetical protein